MDCIQNCNVVSIVMTEKGLRINERGFWPMKNTSWLFIALTHSLICCNLFFLFTKALLMIFVYDNAFTNSKGCSL